MTVPWHEAITKRLENTEAIVSVIVSAGDGSVPRGPGAWMLVDTDGTEGTIGGGRLEWAATALAREMLDTPGGDWRRALKDYPLGPELEQCCGGFVRLLFERLGAAENTVLLNAAGETGLFARPVASGQPLRLLADRRDAKALPLPAAHRARDILSGAAEPQAALVTAGDPDGAWFLQPVEAPGLPLYLYGAGHVGRAIVRALDGLPFDIHWIDTAENRFPETVPARVGKIVEADPAAVAATAPPGAFHLVLTYAHQLDFDICHALLRENVFGFAGLIGSATKRARFFRRFREAGIGEAALARLTCPIGIDGVPGKEPAAIAIAVAAQLLIRQDAAEPVSGTDEQRA